MRNLGLLLVVVLLSACATAPKMGADLGPCQVAATILYKSDEARMRVCTPGDTATWRKLSVHYSTRSQYASGSINSSGDFYAPPGQECADMKSGLIPSSVDSCQRYDMPQSK